MKINMPNEKEINLEIDTIIEKGLIKKQSFYSDLKDMYKNIGLRYLFHDFTEIIFIILFITSILSSIIINGNLDYMGDVKGIYAYVFTISPMLYLAISVFNFINIKQNKTYEIEMTCKYDIYQMSVFRMLVFSIVSILINFFLVYIIFYIYGNINYLKAFIISIASLFIFSLIFLFTINKIKNRLMRHLIVLAWIVLNLSLYIFKADFYINLLNNISIYTWIMVTIGSMYGYIRNLKILVMFSNKGEMI